MPNKKLPFESSPLIRQKLENNSKYTSIFSNYMKDHSTNKIPIEKQNIIMKTKVLSPEKKGEKFFRDEISIKEIEKTKEEISKEKKMDESHHKRTMSFGIDHRKMIETKVKN